MSVRVRMTLIALVLLAAAPGLALAGVCFDVGGLPEAAALDLVPLAAGPQGPIPLAGQAQGLCGLGQAPALVQGIAIVDPSGAARVVIKLLAARPGCTGGEAELVLPPPLATGSGQVRLPEGSVANVFLVHDPTGLACQPRSPSPTACVSNPTTLCLLQNRFRVTATASQAAQSSVPGQALKNSSESGLFAFDTSNVEVVIKVLDGRGLNNFYWVLITTTSDVQYTLTVTDTQTGRVKTYANPVGNLSAPVFDTTAFSASP